MKKKELLRMICELSDRVADLESEVDRLRSNRQYSPTVPLPYVYAPSVWTYPTGCPAKTAGPCEYPTIWHGTTPPPCSRCGNVSGLGASITYTTSTSCEDETFGYTPVCTKCNGGSCSCGAR